jgi:hypothetical protein
VVVTATVLVLLRPPVALMVRVSLVAPVLAWRGVRDRGGDVAVLDPSPVAAVVTGAVPGLILARPVVAICEEDLLVQVADDADAGLDDHQRRQDHGEAEREGDLPSTGPPIRSNRREASAERNGDQQARELSHEAHPFALRGLH